MEKNEVKAMVKEGESEELREGLGEKEREACIDCRLRFIFFRLNYGNINVYVNYILMRTR